MFLLGISNFSLKTLDYAIMQILPMRVLQLMNVQVKLMQ